MATNKTRPEATSVDAFLDAIPGETRQRDARTFEALAAEVTGEPATMWGTSIVGFGSLHYKYESGREGDTALIGFAPRKDSLVIYSVLNHALDLEDRLGPHTTGKGCLYLKDLSKIDLAVLRTMVEHAYAERSAAHA